MFNQHGADTALPQFAKAGEFGSIRLAADRFRHQRLHIGGKGDDAGVELQFDPRAVIEAGERHQPGQRCVVGEQVAAAEPPRRADAAKAGFGSGAGEQGSDGGDDTGGAIVAGIAHLHGDAAAFGQVVAVERAQTATDEEVGARNRRAGMPGEAHRIGVVVFKDATRCGAEEAGERVAHAHGRCLGKKGGESFLHGMSPVSCWNAGSCAAARKYRARAGRRH